MGRGRAYCQSPSLKLNFGNRSQKIRKSRYQGFAVLYNFTEFLYFDPITLFKIVQKNLMPGGDNKVRHTQINLQLKYM